MQEIYYLQIDSDKCNIPKINFVFVFTFDLDIGHHNFIFLFGHLDSLYSKDLVKQ